MQKKYLDTRELFSFCHPPSFMNSPQTKKRRRAILQFQQRNEPRTPGLLTELPVEVRSVVLLRLDRVRDFIGCMLACKALRDVLLADSFWREFVCYRFGVRLRSENGSEARPNEEEPRRTGAKGFLTADQMRKKCSVREFAMRWLRAEERDNALSWRPAWDLPFNVKCITHRLNHVCGFETTQCVRGIYIYISLLPFSLVLIRSPCLLLTLGDATHDFSRVQYGASILLCLDI